jgi:hypothetical protein
MPSPPDQEIFVECTIAGPSISRNPEGSFWQVGEGGRFEWAGSFDSSPMEAGFIEFLVEQEIRRGNVFL